jgi:hypothetical protein
MSASFECDHGTFNIRSSLCFIRFSGSKIYTANGFLRGLVRTGDETSEVEDLGAENWKEVRGRQGGRKGYERISSFFHPIFLSGSMLEFSDEDSQGIVQLSPSVSVCTSSERVS